MADDEKVAHPPPRAKNVRRRVKAKSTERNGKDADAPGAAAAETVAATAPAGTTAKKGAGKTFRRPNAGRKKFGGDAQKMDKEVASEILPIYFLLALGYNAWSFQSIWRGVRVL